MADIDPRFQSLFSQLRSARTGRQKRGVARKYMRYRSKAERVDQGEPVAEPGEEYVGPSQPLSEKSELSYWEMHRLQEYQREALEVQRTRLLAQRGRIDPEGLYTQPIPGYKGYIAGRHIIGGYPGFVGVDPMVSDVEEAHTEAVRSQSETAGLPPYVRFQRTDSGYNIIGDPALQEEYEQERWESLPFETKVGRTVIGSLLYGPKVVTDYFLSGGRYDIKGEGVKRSFEEGKRWESATWHLAQQEKNLELLQAYYTSPLAISAYSYGAFSIGGSVVRAVTPTAKQIFGKYVPRVVKDYTGRYADIRIGKSVWGKYQALGEPSYISPAQRGWLGFVGKPVYGKHYIPFHQRMFTGLESQLYSPIYGTPSRFAIHQEQLALSKLKRIRLDVMKNYRAIQTQTKVFLHPDKPWMGIFKSKVIGRDVFSMGIVESGKHAKVEGVTFWKLSPENVFYQRTPFKSVVKSKYYTDIDDYSLYDTKGLTISNKDLDTLLYSRGLGLQRSYYKGDYFIKGGFLEPIKHDVALGLSQGRFYSKFGRGWFRDYSVVIAPSLDDASTLVDTGGRGFDYSQLSRSMLDDIRMPGGIGVQTSKLSYPRLFEPMQPMFRRGVRLFDDMSTGMSEYWSGIAPSVSKASVNLTASISSVGSKLTSDFVQLSNLGLINVQRSGLKKLSLQRVDTTQVQRVDTAQKSSYKQLQKQLTAQLGILENQLVSTVLAPVVISPPMMDASEGSGYVSSPDVSNVRVGYSPPPPVPFPFLFDGIGQMVPQKEPSQGYIVRVKSRQYVRGRAIGREKFRDLTRVPYNYVDSMNLGSAAVDNSIAQQFYLKPVNRPAKKLKRRIPSTWDSIQHKFYRKGDKFVEDRQAAIDSQGEVDELNVFKWFRQQPLKQLDKGFNIPSFGMDMYGFDKIQGRFDKMFRGLRL